MKCMKKMLMQLNEQKALSSTYSNYINKMSTQVPITNSNITQTNLTITNIISKQILNSSYKIQLTLNILTSSRSKICNSKANCL